MNLLHALARAVAMREVRRLSDGGVPQSYAPSRRRSPLAASAPTPAPVEEITEYEDELRKLPEPLRTHIRRGGFLSDLKAEAWPLILPEWADAAFNRWSGAPSGPMTALGVTVAEDRVTLALRHGDWFDLRTHDGIDATDGPAVAALIFGARRGRCEIGFDLRDGCARPAHDHLRTQGLPVVGIGTEAAQHLRSGFPDMHSVMWWAFREALDPANLSKITLPPDAALKEELEALRWTLTEAGIAVTPERPSNSAEAIANAWACGGEAKGAAKRQITGNLGYAGAKRAGRPLAGATAMRKSPSSQT